jgi:hypothetical protein
MENFNKTIRAAGKLFWYWQLDFLSLTRKFSGWKLKQKDFFTVYAILLLVLFLLFSDELHYIFVSYVNTWFRLNKLDNISRLNRNVLFIINLKGETIVRTISLVLSHEDIDFTPDLNFWQVINTSYFPPPLLTPPANITVLLPYLSRV